MKLVIKIFIFVFFLIEFSSCGKDKFIASEQVSNKSNLNIPSTCACTSSYSPVCGTDGKNYDNSCIAECKKINVAKVGHCVCSDEIIVCGSDGQNHRECDAVKSVDYQITKFVPCKSAEF